MSTSVYLVVALTACIFISGISAQCSINLRTDIPSKDPLYLTNDGQLLAPNGPNLEWSTGNTFTLSCPGSSNVITVAKTSDSSAQCTAGNKFAVGASSYTSSKLECKSTISGDVVSTTEPCINGGIIKRIGFNTDTFGFVNYIDICYDEANAMAMYTYHAIRGTAIDYNMIESTRPSFKVGGMPSGTKPNQSYTQAKQKTRFATLLGSSALADSYFSSTSFLARGHLVPDADGIYRAWQFSTYYYINAAPEWQVVNAGNWLRIENLARQTAAKIQDNIDVYTGTSDVLTLPNNLGVEVPITLEDDGRLPVPKWFWKILKHNNSAIAFITLNNPFVTVGEEVCPNICEQNGWANEAYADLTRGYTYCCEVSDLMAVVSNVPAEAYAPNILQNL